MSLFEEIIMHIFLLSYYAYIWNVLLTTPNDNTLDPSNPMRYQGITIACNLYICYTVVFYIQYVGHLGGGKQSHSGWTKWIQTRWKLYLPPQYSDQSENGLYLHSWCECKSMVMNIKKIQVVYFRPMSIPHTTYNFKTEEHTMLLTDWYKYRGLILTEFLDFNITVIW